MKRILIIAAMAAAATTVSCTKDTELESAAKSQDNLIAFNVNAQNATRADITTANINLFSATAIVNGTGTKYFDNVEFSKNGQTFNSANPYYWPDKVNLNFFAYAPVIGKQVPDGNNLVRTDYNKFTVTTPYQQNEANYTDLVFANTNDKAKADGTNGVAINFRHAESKIVVKVKNSAPNLRFEITDWKLAFYDNEANFVYTDANTDTHNNGKLSIDDWSENTNYSINNWNTFPSRVSLDGTVVNPIQLKGEMILIPQQTQMAVRYTDGTVKRTKVNGMSADGTTNVGGSYLALQMKIYNQGTNVTVFSNEAQEWAIWPVAFDWEPGYKYTYVIDLAGGGYYEENHIDINKDKDDLDPILGENAIIKFVNVTVDEWDETQPEQPVNMLLTDAVRRAASFKSLSKGGIMYSGDQDRTVSLRVNSSDFMWPSYVPGTQTVSATEAPADINNNNVFKDVKNFFAGLNYAGTPVESIEFNGNTYTWNDSSFVKADGDTIENVIASAIFLANYWDSAKKEIKKQDKNVSANASLSIGLKGNAQDHSEDEALNFNLLIESFTDEADLVKFAANSANIKREGDSASFSYSDDSGLVMKASVEDFKWNGFPALEGKIGGEDINANENAMFRNIKLFIDELFAQGATGIILGEVPYDKEDSLELTKALAAAGFAEFFDPASNELKSGSYSASLKVNGTEIAMKLIATK